MILQSRGSGRRWLVAFSLGSLLSGSAASQSFQVERKDGLTLVRNGAEPASVPGAPKRVRLVHELTIGGENDPDEMMIFAIRTVQVGDGGEIFVLDDKIHQVKVYGPDGRYLRTIGKTGQGPGELRSPTQMKMLADGNLCLFDVGNSRVSVYSPGGACLKEIPLAGWRPVRYLPDSRGFGYGDLLDFQGGVKDVLLKFDPKLNRIATIATLVMVDHPSEKMIPVEMFRLVYQVDRQDRIVWASTGAYELNVVGADGTPVRKILREYEKRPFSRAERDQRIKESFAGQAPPPDVEPVFSPHKPVLYYFLFDDEGRTYVRTFEKDDRGSFFYDVFDGEGRFFARLALPESELLWVVKKGKAYTYIEENEAGIPQVRRYALAWE
ncbi:MAG: 6-bladed beta-propeller [Acidobacteriota bacterium]